ncbi:MAG: hypothetical protein ACRD3E_16355 [Terriglobales bacterium]
MLTIRISLCLLLAGAFAFGQQPRLNVAPVPSDPLELVTGTSKVVDDAQERATVFELLERARQNATFQAGGAPAYAMRVSFEASGNVSYTGSGSMLEVWQSPRNWRWTAQLGSYHQDRLLAFGRMHDKRTDSFVPMRLQMVRGALFWPMWFNPRALTRVAPAKIGGTDVICGLLSAPINDPAVMQSEPGRRWVETEFCLDPKLAVLRSYSEAPGIYTVYDYSDALQFHGHLVARNITITEGGNTVLKIHVDSVSDPSADDLALLRPSADLLSSGSEPALEVAYRIPQYVNSQDVNPNSMVKPVIVHAIVGPDGRVLDAEALQNYDPQIAAAALDLVRRSTYAPQRGEFGNAQREYFINVKFLPPQQQAGGGN